MVVFLAIGPMMEDDLLFKSETYQIIGACMEVHRTLGCGFFEPEVKALSALTTDHEAQILNYLKATGLKVGRW